LNLLHEEKSFAELCSVANTRSLSGTSICNVIDRMGFRRPLESNYVFYKGRLRCCLSLYHKRRDF